MSNPEVADEAGTGARPKLWNQQNWLVIGVFAVLTVLGILLTTGVLFPGVVDTADPPAETAPQVPAYVYLYASLGALGYIFTRLMTRLEAYDEWGELKNLAKMGLRIPAAWILASGVYLLMGFIVPTDTVVTARVEAGVAFLVGLYVNVAFKSLGGLADRLLGRPTTEAAPQVSPDAEKRGSGPQAESAETTQR